MNEPVQLAFDATSIVLALAATAIGLLQWFAMRQDKWIQLFDRRYQLYRDLGSAVAQCLQEGEIPAEAAAVFREGSHLAPILFGEKVQSSADALWHAAYWRTGKLKPKDWPKSSGGESKTPVDIVSESWDALKPQLVDALKRWR